MTPREIIEAAVKILEDQINTTRHIPRLADINKIRACHLRELAGALQAPEHQGLSISWADTVQYQLVLSRIIIERYKKAKSPKTFTASLASI